MYIDSALGDLGHFIVRSGLILSSMGLLHFYLSLKQALNLFSVLNEVVDVDDAHRVDGP